MPRRAVGVRNYTWLKYKDDPVGLNRRLHLRERSVVLSSQIAFKPHQLHEALTCHCEDTVLTHFIPTVAGLAIDLLISVGLPSTFNVAAQVCHIERIQWDSAGLGWKEKRPRLNAKGVSNATGRARTSNLRFRRPMLYPIELRSRVRLHCCRRRGDDSENCTRRHGGDSCRDPRDLRTTGTATEHRDLPILGVLKALLTSRPIVPRSPAYQGPCAPRRRPRPSVD